MELISLTRTIFVNTKKTARYAYNMYLYISNRKKWFIIIILKL